MEENKDHYKKQTGFTIVELLMDLTIIGILLGIIFLLVDPIKQINLLQGQQKEAQLLEIKQVIDTYYSQNKCYPQDIPFGKVWQERGKVYMEKVPQSQDCNNTGGSCYSYVTDTSSECPQWNSIFTKLSEIPRNSQVQCSLPATCVPQNYELLGLNACVYGGSIDCTQVSKSKIPLLYE